MTPARKTEVRARASKPKNANERQFTWAELAWTVMTKEERAEAEKLFYRPPGGARIAFAKILREFLEGTD